MDNKQQVVEALWAAAKEAGLNEEQIGTLSVTNVYTKQGPIAERMRVALARVAPDVAKQMLAEAGTEPSLQAQAAAAGLTPMTDALRAELDSFSPMSAEEARAARIEELISSNPYGTQGRYDEQGTYHAGQPGNLSAALELEALAPERAAALKLAATPPKPNPNALSAEGAAYVNAKVASLNHAAGQV